MRAAQATAVVSTVAVARRNAQVNSAHAAPYSTEGEMKVGNCADACLSCDDNYNTTLYRERIVTARKAHK